MTELSARVIEVRAIAKLLWFLPPPARAEFADKLHGLGLRHHPELATLELETLGPQELGNHAPQRVISKTTTEKGMDVLRQIPELAHIADEIDAARTEQEKAQVAAKLMASHRAASAQADALIKATPPADLEDP